MMYIEGARKRQFGSKEPLFRSGHRSPRRAQSSLGSSSSPTRVSQTDDNIPTSSRSSSTGMLTIYIDNNNIPLKWQIHINDSQIDKWVPGLANERMNNKSCAC